MKNSVFVAIGLATLGLVFGYALSSFWVGVVVIAALGLLWQVGQWRDWAWVAPLGLISFVGVAAVGVWLGAAAGWMLVGVVATLMAWELSHFARRLSKAAQIEGEATLRRAHHQRLLTVAGLGLLLGGAALSFRLSLNLGWAILFGLLAIIGLSRVIGSLRREGD